MPSLRTILETPTFVALPDNHGETRARRAAEMLLGSGTVSNFFIEFDAGGTRWNRNNDGLNIHMASLRGQPYQYVYDRLYSWFSRLNGGDQRPTLHELAANATSLGIPTFACDLQDGDVLSKKFVEQGLMGGTSSFGPSALEIRNVDAATQIAKNLTASPNQQNGRLALWGAAHFSNDPFMSTGYALDTLLQGFGYEVHVARSFEMLTIAIPE